MPADPSTSDPAQPTPGPGSGPAAPLGMSLGGDLPCVVCGYNLRGLSIRAHCPECGTAVRATILAVVDPLARELQPVRSRWLVAGGLLLWAGAGLIAALLAWVPHLADAAAALGLYSPAPPGIAGIGRARSVSVADAMTAMVVLSGLGALALVSPHRGLPRRNVISALVALALYVPAAYLVYRLGGLTDQRLVSPLLDSGGLSRERSTLRLMLDVCLIGIVLGLRPNARVLVARSLALRTGRVDRQTLMAIALAACVTAVGDILHTALVATGMPTGLPGGVGGAAGSTHEIAFLAGTALVAMGSALITGGFAGSLADCLRIARSVLSPGPSLAHVIGPGPAGPARESAR